MNNAVRSTSNVLLLSMLGLAFSACGGGGSGSGGNTSGAGSSSASTYTVGGTITNLAGLGLVLQLNGSNSLAVSSGSTFNFATSLASGSSYSVTILSQPANPGQVCSVANGNGTIASANISNIAIRCTYRTGRFVFVGNGASSGTTISAYTSDATTGVLTPVSGSPFAAVKPAQLTLDPLGRYLYATNLSANSISAYSIDFSTGSLSQIAGSPFTTGTTPYKMAFTPDGSFAYVPNRADATISAYAVNSITGTLTQIAGSPFTTAPGPTWIAINATGTYAYVTNQTAGVVSAYAINGSTGALTSVSGSPFTAGTQPFSTTIDPLGQLAFAANFASNTLSIFSINSSTGGLSLLLSPAVGLTAPVEVTSNASGTIVYTGAVGISSGGTGGGIAAHSLNRTTGTLTPITGSPFASGVAVAELAFNPARTFAYAANPAGNVLAFSVDSVTGALTQVSGSPFAAMAGTSSIAID